MADAVTAAVPRDIQGSALVRTVSRDAIGDFLARATVGVLFALLARNLLQEFARTGHLTGLLLLASEALVVVLTVFRRRASIVDRTAAARLLTAVSVAGPPLLRAADVVPLAPDALTGIVSAAGLLVVVVAKLALGRSFGIVPANRGVVVRGPYTIVRHPIYLGYLVTHAAFLAAHPTAINVALVLIADGALIARAVLEERVLAADAQYQEYNRRVPWRFVPGVF
jgi:protein-S-isoprenylcysteine O-methyltransferase Ste14